MLSLKNIIKEYPAGNATVPALNGISLDFRENEFVSILGPSGCGKTTLLNIIGGLDQYTSGDLIINGVSTKEFKDADWDSYRNHSIGFVFQSYNLIPHQTVLANVELALTLSGVSPKERKRRATEALRQVGLTDRQINKKPNQMSGGQMQRVAIARALVNDPDILLADEPTGALDTKTSIQIMEILRGIAKKKLIIMVTHNPELAKKYSTRIIRVLDGRVVGDTRPYREGEPDIAPGLFRFFPALQKTPETVSVSPVTESPKKEKKKKKRRGSVFGKKRSMSFFTALSLSRNNLMTKKGRTFMTAFAGSIGIIGIALILSVSSGVNAYINSVQRDTLASYPIQLDAETADLTSMISTLMSSSRDKETYAHDLDKVYESVVLAQLMNSLGSVSTNTNDLKSFKEYLETTDKFDDYLSAVRYAYNFNWSVFVREGNELGDANGKVVKSDVGAWLAGLGGGSSSSTGMMGGGLKVWEELLSPLDPADETDLINPLIKEQYELIDGGKWPTASDEVVLIVDEQNEVSDLALFALGLRTEADMNMGLMAGFGGGSSIDIQAERKSWTYEEIRSMRFRLILASECFEKQLDGTYLDLSTTDKGRTKLYNDDDIGFTLKVVGVIRPKEEATSSFLNGSIGYTSALAKKALDRTKDNALLNLQVENKEKDVLSGLPFKTGEEISFDEKKNTVTSYLNTLAEPDQRAFLLTVLAVTPTDAQIQAKYEELSVYPNEVLLPMVQAALTQAPNLPYTAEQVLANDQLKGLFLTAIATSAVQNELNESTYGSKTVAEMFALLSEEQINTLYESDNVPHGFSDSNYQKNLVKLGAVLEENPASILLYASSFEDKDEISRLINDYNDSVEEEKKIDYTDYVALLMSSITTIVNAISYVLIAFVAISLVVSSIMIGIITYISVLERTKEIGILRAIGASKRDVGRVFNAETLIVGFIAGVIGIGATLLLNQVINVILYHYTGIAALKAVLPMGAAFVLVGISMFLTFIAGLLPSGFAARKNPVEALRTE